MREYKDLLIQKLRFDLGVDEYRGRIPRAQTAKRAAEEQRRLDYEKQMQIYDAYKTAEEIFERRLGKASR